MEALIDAHQANTHLQAEVVVADTKYGTIENLLTCAERGIEPHIPDVSATHIKRAQMQGLFPAGKFRYDAGSA